MPVLPDQRADSRSGVFGKTPPLEVAQPVRTAPWPPWPCFEQDEIEAVVAVLRSGKVNYWTGEQGRQFEREFAEFCGCNYAVALANGTVALELALHALGIGRGDEVVTTSRTFIASASAIVMRGATPVIADVDRVSQNLTAETVRNVLTPRTRAIIAVHLAGWPCDMTSLQELAKEHHLKIIEDCAQAHGAAYKGAPVGSLGDAAAFSFCQDKIMTTGGEGGMLTTNDRELWQRAWAYKDHGKNYDVVYGQPHTGGFRWLHESFGTNWRMTEMQATVGRIVLPKSIAWVTARRRNAALLTNFFKQIPALRVTEPDHDIYHSYYKYYVFVRTEQLNEGWDRDRIAAAVNAEGVPCHTGSCSEIYLEKSFKQMGFGPVSRLPVAEELSRTSLMFLVHPTSGEQEMRDICQAMGKVMKKAAKSFAGTPDDSCWMH